MSAGILRISAFLCFVFVLQQPLQAGCVDSVHIKVKPVQCYGLRNGVIDITEIFGGQAPFYFSLDGQSYSTRPTFDLLWAGDYNLYVRDSTGCVTILSVLVPQPEELKVKISLLDTATVVGEWVQLKATVYPPGSVLTDIKWRPPALFPTQNQLTQIARFTEDTDVFVEVRSKDGCIARDILTVQVEETNLYFPNVFRPGSEQDNYFTLFAGDGVERVLLLQVFNRNGSMVFEKRNFLPNDPLIGWDGKWHGQLAPAGVYVWAAQVVFLDGKRHRFSGSVTLLPD